MIRGDDQSEKQAILEAMDRLMKGEPLRSDGKLTIKSLAVEAGLGRHMLTQKHTDLKDLFEQRLHAAGTKEEPTAIQKLRDEIDGLKRKNAELTHQLRDEQKLTKNLTRQLAMAVPYIKELERRKTDAGSTAGSVIQFPGATIDFP